MNTIQPSHVNFWFTFVDSRWSCIQQCCYSGISNTLMSDSETVLSVVLAPVRPQAFSVVFQKAVLKAEPDEALKQRVSNLIDSITSSVFQYTTRGLFECDKLTYIAQLAFQVGMEASLILCMVCSEKRHAIEISCSWDQRPCSDLIKWKGKCGLCWKYEIWKSFLFVVSPDSADE